MAFRSRKGEATTQPSAIRGEMIAPEAPMRKPLTILLVDDEKNMRRVMEIFIRGMGHRPVTASSGNEALRIFRRGRIDLVISDYQMPGMDGLKLFKELKKLDPEVSVKVFPLKL
jgi:CheY-like chemotaxis protein